MSDQPVQSDKLEITEKTYPIGTILERPGKTAKVLGISKGLDKTGKTREFKGYHCLFTTTATDGTVREQQGLLRVNDLEVSPERGGWKPRKAAPIITSPADNAPDEFIFVEMDGGIVVNVPVEPLDDAASPNKSELDDENLPIRQIEMLQALVTGQPIVKNAATRMALRRYGYITQDDDWDAIQYTEAGRKWLIRNNLMPTDSDLTATAQLIKDLRDQVDTLQRDLDNANALIETLTESRESAIDDAVAADSRVAELTEALAEARAANVSPSLLAERGQGGEVLTVPRQEVKTLIQKIGLPEDSKKADQELADHLNDEWQKFDCAVGGVESFSIRIVTLTRVCRPAPAPEPARTTFATVGAQVTIIPPTERVVTRQRFDPEAYLNGVLADCVQAAQAVYDNAPPFSVRPLSLMAPVVKPEVRS